jgi:RNA polymerase-binding transcription factor DksA
MLNNTSPLSRLEAKRDELSHYLHSLTGDLEIGHAAESEENAMLAQGRESTAQEIRRSRRMLANVECAIARWKLGVYGDCVSCDKPISPKRLEAIPETAHCIRCAVAEVLR